MLDPGDLAQHADLLPRVLVVNQTAVLLGAAPFPHDCGSEVSKL